MTMFSLCQEAREFICRILFYFFKFCFHLKTNKNCFNVIFVKFRFSTFSSVALAHFLRFEVFDSEDVFPKAAHTCSKAL